MRQSVWFAKAHLITWESALNGDGHPALHAVSLFGGLLHNFLNRVGRPSTEHEIEWQQRERERCLRVLQERFAHHMSPLLKAKIYAALRSATAIHCPENIRLSSSTFLARTPIEDAVCVVDAICTSQITTCLLLSTEFSEVTWEEPISELMSRGRTSLERIVVENAENQARFTIDHTQACLELQVKTGGFHRFMLAFKDRPDFLAEMADQSHKAPSHRWDGELVLSSVFTAIHISEPEVFSRTIISSSGIGGLK